MAKETPMSGNNEPIQISLKDFTLHAPGLHGVVKELDANQTTTRGPGVKDPMHKLVMDSAKDNEIRLFGQFEIEVSKDDLKGAPQSQTRAAGVTRATKMGEPAMVLNAPKNTPNMGSAVLYTDEDGESRWVFPEDKTEKDKFTFLIPREGAPPVPTDGTTVRGAVTKGIRRIVKVFAWLTDEVVGVGALILVKNWENKKRMYGLNTVLSDRDDAPVDWDKISGERSLLLLHGTFSTWQAAFDGLRLSKTWFPQMQELYGNRIFAFNHPSLHQTPAENVGKLMEMLPDGVELDIDIITHSRGGLVGREMCERLANIDPFGRKIAIKKAVFVAGPHTGTILTNKEHIVTLIDAYTNMLTNLPDNPATIIMEALISLVKIIGGGTVGALPGMQSMLPDGDYLKRLNATGPVDTTYYAMGARYAPNDEKILLRFGKRLLMKAITKIFNEDSDMVVPTKGSFDSLATNGGFPIPENRQKLYQLDDDINHINFFEHDVVNKQLFNWLSE
ncbi:MAG: hypothetical protein DHS20C18_20870 [Saprospiraceae bacterium]|nr:MAG: hypothetical protein DHS20C18_20870 [Saprospiraceae bacterium]